MGMVEKDKSDYLVVGLTESLNSTNHQFNTSPNNTFIRGKNL